MQATYWQKLSQRVEAVLDLVFLPHPSPRDGKALTTAGLRYDLRQATVRAQLDSIGKVSMLLEQHIAPTFTFSIAGELDHFKVPCSFLLFSVIWFVTDFWFLFDHQFQSKFGVGIQLESSPLEENALQGVTPPSPPM